MARVRTARAALAGVLFVCSLIPSSVLADDVSPDGVWRSVSPSSIPALHVSGFDTLRPAIYRAWAVDEAALLALLDAAPLEGESAAGRAPAVLTVPMPDGSWARFAVEDSPLLSPQLAAQHPELRTWVGQGLDDPTATARFDHTPAGFHAMVIGASGRAFVDPYQRGDTEHYMSYWRRDAVAEAPFACDVADEPDTGEIWLPRAPSGSQRRTYRLAMTATGEYSQFFGGMSQAQSAITTTVNRVNGIYEREVAIRLTLTAFNIYTDPTTDPFPNGTTVDGTLLDENQSDLDANVGSGNYDIGHIVSAMGTGGLAQQGVCQGNKGRGGTSRPSPQGDAFDVDYVAHEMGHQFSGSHTFNGTTMSCGMGNRSASSAYEPGSGTTIMAYAGICAAENVQSNSDAYFHTRSFDQITSYREGSGNCGAQSATGNNAPMVDAGPNFTIPRDTPFRLTASVSDPDSDPVTFCWEQYDLGTASPPANNADGPVFRSRIGTSSPTRTLPRFSDLLSGAATPWEHLPTVDRTLNFRVTARDNRAGGGGVDYDSMAVTVSGAPFRITHPAPGDNLECGASNSVTWDVGGGSVAPNVKILYSSSGGSAFSTLNASTANDGSENVTIPAVLTNDSRVEIDAVGNIFFTLSRAIPVRDTADPSITCPANATAECSTHGGTPKTDSQLASFFSGVSATDVCDATPTLSDNAPSLFPLGSTSVTFTATDDSSNDSTCSRTVTVQDMTAPMITCPSDITVECTGNCGIEAGDPHLAGFFSGVSAMDVCDAMPTISNNAPAFIMLGDTPVTFTATDHSNNSSSCTAVVHVVDTKPPTIEVELDRYVLWPPNHKLTTINATVLVRDICDPKPGFRLESILSNEDDEGLGDGDFPDDIQNADYGESDTSFDLRSERAGGGDGREYSITYVGFDKSGNETPITVVVRVPHDGSGHALGGAGFNHSGSGLLNSAQQFRLLVLSSVDFDATTVDPVAARLGNHLLEIQPVGSRLLDVDGDGLLDLELTFAAAPAKALRTASSPTPVGLRYTTGTGPDAGWVVPDIFGLGTPLHQND